MNITFLKRAAGTFVAAFAASLIITLPSAIESGDLSTPALISLLSGALATALRIVEPLFSPFLTLDGERARKSEES